MSSNNQKSFTKLSLCKIEVFFFTSMVGKNELNLLVCSKHFVNFLKGLKHAQENWTKFMSMLDSLEKPFGKDVSVPEENELNSRACLST